MKNTKLLIVLSLLLQLAYSSLVHAKESIENNYDYVENSAKASDPVYQDPTGVRVEFYHDGTIKSIKSLGESELQFGDHKDIRQAIKKATMRAKAGISKFMKESIKSNDVADEISDTISNQSITGNTDATKETLESSIETLQNSSSAILSGVITLSQDIKREERYVTVLVGIKKETIEIASEISSRIGSGIKQDQKYKSQLSNTSTNTDNASNGGGREIRRSKMYDDF